MYGYSLAFTDSNAFVGGFDKLFMKGVTPAGHRGGHLRKRVWCCQYIFASFELTFAAITPALIIGGFAGLNQVLGGAGLHGAVVHLLLHPVAHMVWYWAGRMPSRPPKRRPRQVKIRRLPCSARAPSTFAGGTVVHINAGIAALIGSR